MVGKQSSQPEAGLLVLLSLPSLIREEDRKRTAQALLPPYTYATCYEREDWRRAKDGMALRATILFGVALRASAAYYFSLICAPELLLRHARWRCHIRQLPCAELLLLLRCYICRRHAAAAAAASHAPRHARRRAAPPFSRHYKDACLRLCGARHAIRHATPRHASAVFDAAADAMLLPPRYYYAGAGALFICRARFIIIITPARHRRCAIFACHRHAIATPSRHFVMLLLYVYAAMRARKMRAIWLYDYYARAI